MTSHLLCRVCVHAVRACVRVCVRAYVRACVYLFLYVSYVGYVQGMSDLLAPILTVMDDEIEAFWCFAGLMDSVVRNHHMGTCVRACMCGWVCVCACVHVGVAWPMLYQILKTTTSLLCLLFYILWLSTYLVL